MTVQSSDGTKYNNEASYNRGYDAIIAFHNVNATKYKDKYGYTLVQLVKTLSARKGQSFFIEGIGDAIQLADMSKSQAKTAMELLANRGAGKIPASNGAFYSALSDEATSVNWIDASSFVLVESAKDVVTGAVKVGDSVIKTGANILSSAESISANLAWILPLIAIGGAAFFIYSNSKELKGMLK